MKIKTLSILTALALVLTVPLIAQNQEPVEPMNDETMVEQTDQNLDQQQEAIESSEPMADQQELQASDQSVDPAVDSEERELPQTASPLALIALIGTGAAGSAFGLRALRRS